ncbi:hypothetical protein NECAME_03840 [Necator americanus]|uniref:Reverse transcriptase domain-containing protein n=1 Tax=Necator americanus TaxID=51031 RepID=W2T2B0_NECAM|nr:hypothetical protein NECAME_03840 [Necator americanus]ETN75117.1 hypothetical protein NECAME_03840 [Necator americanus]
MHRHDNGIQKQPPRTLLFADDVILASESRDDLQKQYFGSKVTSKGDIDQEGRARVNAAWMKWKMATGVLCDKKVPTVVRPVAFYGCWPTTKALERVLHAMEIRILRWTIGVTLKVSNDTVRSIFGVAPITEKMMEARQMVWSRLAAREKFCCQNRPQARRFRREAAREAKDSLVWTV